jgi:hypothetical protein
MTVHLTNKNIVSIKFKGQKAIRNSNALGFSFLEFFILDNFFNVIKRNP